MEFLFAPLEGITYPEYRQIHHRLFPGANQYYSPFIAPGGNGEFKPGFLERLHPDAALGINLVPQIMANNPLAFIDTAMKLKALGYDEVNLNAGCPSGTVFAKHKGSGMLLDLKTLDSFLDTIFSKADISISVKTRMGVESTDEFRAILDIYNKYPIKKLIIHARDRSGQYQSIPDIEGFAEAFSKSSNPVAYNGDIFSHEDLNKIIKLVPSLQSVMIGRGAAANPALIRILQGGHSLQLKEFINFHDSLLGAYLSKMDERAAINRMKNLWYYMDCLFNADPKYIKAINKSKKLSDYKSAVSALCNCDFNGSAAFTAKE